MGKNDVSVHWAARKCPACGGRMETYQYHWILNVLGITHKKFKCKVCGFEQRPDKMRKAFEAKHTNKPKKGHKKKGYKKHHKKKRKR